MPNGRVTGECGWIFPGVFLPSAGHLGPVASMTHTEEENLRQSIALILQITPGERPLLPGFGCDLSRFVFERFDVSLGAAIGATVRRALEQWEPRIVVNHVAVTPIPAAEGHALTISITYTVRRTRRTETIELPFTPGEARATLPVLSLA